MTRQEIKKVYIPAVIKLCLDKTFVKSIEIIPAAADLVIWSSLFSVVMIYEKYFICIYDIMILVNYVHAGVVT